MIALLLLGAVATATAAAASCSTLGPATMQNATARSSGGEPLGAPLSGVASAAACASHCCATAHCRSWTHVAAVAACELRSGYSEPTPNATASSGVTYRAGVQDPLWGELRGFNYVPPAAVNDIDMWVNYSKAATERDMAIAQQTGFNFCRVFLNYHVWEAQPAEFLANVQHFIATAHAHGVNTMPIPFDLCWFGCRDENVTAASHGRCWYPSPQFSLADDRSWWHAAGEKYVDALVGAVPASTPGLILWDVVNEPESGGSSGLPGENGTRWSFVKHFVAYFQSKTKTPTTAGVASVGSLGTIGSSVDILTFHSYHHSWELGLQRTEMALGFSRQYNKPVFNSETGCIARANAFDQTMEMAIRNGIGFAVWELMISDCLDCIDTRRWKHGLMFTDGTTRDPSAIAALHGVFLNRGDNVGMAVARPDVEHAVSGTVQAADGWLKVALNASSSSCGTPHAPGGRPSSYSNDCYQQGYELLDSLANMGESAQLLPLAVPLSSEARRLAASGDSPENREAIAALLRSQLGALSATKMGVETGPGVCEFPGAPLPAISCEQATACTLKQDTDLRFFDYVPPASTSTSSRCWRGVPCPNTAAGSLHYCDQAKAHVDFNISAVPPLSTATAAAAAAGQLSAVNLIVKTGPDCGKFDVLVDGKAVLTNEDSYSHEVDWYKSIPLLTGATAEMASTVRVVVRGEHAVASSHAWVQVVGVELWQKQRR